MAQMTTGRLRDILRRRNSKAGRATAWLPYEFVNGDGTMIQAPTRNGERERWLFMRLPSAQIIDANPEEILEHGNALRRGISKLYLDPSSSLADRIIVDADRQVHLLWLSWPDMPEVPSGASEKLSEMMREDLYPLLHHRRRCAYIGVQLVPDVNMELKEAIKEVAVRFLGKIEIPSWEAYEEDELRVRQILSGMGAREMQDVESKMLRSWISRGTNPLPHLEVSPNEVLVDGKYRIECASLVSAQPEMTPGVDTWMAYAANLSDGVAPDAFSVKGSLIDPVSLVGRLSKARKVAIENVQQTSGSSQGVELEAVGQARNAGDLRAEYQLKKEPAIDRVQIVAARFLPEDRGSRPQKSFTEFLNRRFEQEWTPMKGRQQDALFAMMPCSSVRFPSTLEHAISVTQVAHMGLGDDPSLGDATGVVMGTDATGRPVLLNYRSASESDDWPTMIIPGASGAGKTMWAQWIAYQHWLQGVPGVIINPKVGQPLHGIANLLEANVASISGADKNEDGSRNTEGGALDFFSWADPQDAAVYAGEYIGSVLGGSLSPDQNTDVRLAMTKGADAGARCVGDCLEFIEDGQVFEKILREHQASPLFRLAVGMEARERVLQRTGGWTVVEMDRPLNTSGDGSVAARLGAATMGLIVMANYMNLVRQGGGVLMADEFHVMLKDGPSRERFMYINRNARSHNVMPILFSQFPDDFLDASGDSEWSPSRRLLLRQTEDRHIRSGLDFVGMSQEQFRYDMLKNANANRETGRSPRGYFADVRGRKGQITLGPIPEWFLRKVSTNLIEVEERRSSTGE